MKTLEKNMVRALINFRLDWKFFNTFLIGFFIKLCKLILKSNKKILLENSHADEILRTFTKISNSE